MASWISSDPILRTEDDEDIDQQALAENFEKAAFEDWPNEAGFAGLTEHRGPIELKVKGTIPAWCVGTLYRTGPGMCDVETDTGTFHISHWFDGLAHTHKFDIAKTKSPKDGEGNGLKGDVEGTVTVLYSSRRQSEALEQDIKKKGAYRGVSFGQKRDPCMGLFAKAMSIWTPGPDVGNVCVTVKAGMPGFEPEPQPQSTSSGSLGLGHRSLSSPPKTVVLGTDAAWFSQVDPNTLEVIKTVRQSTLHPELKGELSAAHGQMDPKTGEYFNYNLQMGVSSKYKIFRVRPSGTVQILATINHAGTYIHSFFLTEKYVILCMPVAQFGRAGMDIPLQGNMMDAIMPFDESKQCKWFIVDRRHGRGVVAEFSSRAAFFFHSVNAFEDEDGDVFCDLVEYKNTDIMFAFYYNVLLNRDNSAVDFWRKGSRSKDAHHRLVRYRFPMKEDPVRKSWASWSSYSNDRGPPKLVFSIPAPHSGELPTINPNYRCRKQRFVYSLPSRGFSTLFDAIAKTDTVTRDVLMWSGPAGHSPGEPIFVPRPSPDGREMDEDDGALLSVVLDGANRTSYLLCLDAKTMKELGRAECEFAIGFGFHGTHVPAATATDTDTDTATA